ncbi:hypothetical protein L195_g025992, partial [Trifolium pratense]
ALETRIDELTSLVKQFALSKAQPTKVCSICTSAEHPTDSCPILQDESITELPQAYATNLYNRGNNQNRYNTPELSTNRYHPSWANHPLPRYGNPTAHQNTPHVVAPPTAASGPSLEDLIKQMDANNIQFQQRTDSSIQKMERQIGQLANSINVIQQAQGSNQLPAQTVVNPNVPNPNVGAITLRFGN